MKTVFFSLLVTTALTLSSRAVLTTFSYAQSDSATGAGTIAAFTYNDGGGDINFGSTAMPAATVFNPQPVLTPAGYVGAMNAQSGNSNEPNVAVGLLWSGSVIVTGTRGADTYTMSIPFVFASEVNQTPTDTNDYNWSVAYGDNPAGGNDVTGTGLRFAFYLSRDTVIDALETANTFQRYTQLTQNLVAGQDSFTNTDLTNTAIKDATDGGAPAGTDAAGRDLAFYWAWRNGGALGAGNAILVDSFAVGGLLNADESTLRLVPEPSTGLLALTAFGFLFRRRR